MSGGVGRGGAGASWRRRQPPWAPSVNSHRRSSCRWPVTRRAKRPRDLESAPDREGRREAPERCWATTCLVRSRARLLRRGLFCKAWAVVHMDHSTLEYEVRTNSEGPCTKLQLDAHNPNDDRVLTLKANGDSGFRTERAEVHFVSIRLLCALPLRLLRALLQRVSSLLLLLAFLLHLQIRVGNTQGTNLPFT